MWDLMLLDQAVTLGGLKKNLLSDVEGGDVGAVRKIISRETIKRWLWRTWIGVIWFRLFVKRVMNILFSKEFRRVFLEELRKL